MLDELAKKDIEKISFDILSQSKSIDVFPTPVDQLLSYSNLVLNHQGRFVYST